MDAFCLCLKSQPTAKVKSLVSWLFVATLMQICNKKKQAEQGRLRSVQFKKERGIRKLNGTNSCVRERTRLKGLKGAVSSGLDSTQLRFQHGQRN